MSKILISDYGSFAIQLLSGKRRKDEQQLAARRANDVLPYLNVHPPLRILDLANGKLSPQLYILAKGGHEVCGVDLVNGRFRGLNGRLYQLSRWMIRLQLKLSAAEVRRSVRLIRGDVARLPLASQSFDMVTSVAAFEHFLQVDSVLNEVHRVLTAGGLAWIGIHPFASLSGGHNVRLLQFPLRDLPPGVDPWDHLRKRKIPFRVPLNEWRIPQYREALAARFEILKDYCAMTEGEAFLTPEIEAELCAYSRDELLCGAHTFLVRKRA